MESLFHRVAHLLKHQSSPSSSAEDILKSLGAPSVSIAVLHRGKIASHCFSTLGHGTDTLFQACSISKPVTAMVAARLVDQGVLNWDSKLLHVLPSRVFRAMGPESLLREITVKQLLSHTSGLDNWEFPGYPNSERHSPLPPLDNIICGEPGANTMGVKLRAFPGKDLRYSGGGFIVLQRIMEIVTNESFPKLATRQVFEPLDMTRSSFTLELKDSNVSEAFYNGFTKCEENYHIFPEFAAAGLWTTPTDLIKLISALQNSLSPSPASKTSPYLKKTTAREVLTEVKNGRGISWTLSKPDGNAFCHSGENEPGYTCHVAGFADVTVEGSPSRERKQIEEGCGIAIMTNSREGRRVYYPVQQIIAYLMGWPDMGVSSGFWTPFPDRRRSLDDTWEQWIGAWSDGWSIEKDGRGKPAVRYREFSTRELIPVAMSARKFESGSSIDLLIDGLQTMLRFYQETSSGHHVIEVREGLTGESQMLKRNT